MSGSLAGAQAFEGYRRHLLAVAHRILHNQADAEDVVQDSWLRFARVEFATIDNLGGWLTTCVTRLCLDRLRRRGPQPVELIEDGPDENVAAPESAAVLAVEVESALAVVLDSLTPAQRVSLVLHDVFGLPFDNIAMMLGVAEETARRQASRARTRLRNRQRSGIVTAGDMEPGTRRQHAALVRTFVAAAGTGDVTSLTVVLHPDVVRTADPHALPDGAPLTLSGRSDVIAEAGVLAANARQGQIALLLGEPVVVVGSLEAPDLILTFAFADAQIRHYDVMGDPQRLTAAQRHLAPAQ